MAGYSQELKDSIVTRSSTIKFKSADKWSSQDKFQIVLKTAVLNEIELAEYCRKRGCLHD